MLANQNYNEIIFCYSFRVKQLVLNLHLLSHHYQYHILKSKDIIFSVRVESAAAPSQAALQVLTTDIAFL